MSIILSNQGNLVLNNIDLFKYIRETDFKEYYSDSSIRSGSKSSIKSVAYTIATFRNNTTSQCNPGLLTIAKGSGISIDSARRSINFLEDIYFIIKVGNKKVTNSNRYYFVYDIQTLIEMYSADNHEMSKTIEYEYVESAILKYHKIAN